MKKQIIISCVLLVSLTAVLATTTFPFQGWDWLKQRSPDILIVRCTNIPPVELQIGPGRAEIEVTSVLKGTNHTGPAQLASFYWPKPGENYLVFGDYNNGFVYAFEEYRVVQLGTGFNTNMIPPTSLDEQVKTLLRRRIHSIDWQMKREAEEKRRLEEAFKN